jgi:hypothetical protein
MDERFRRIKYFIYEQGYMGMVRFDDPLDCCCGHFHQASVTQSLWMGKLEPYTLALWTGFVCW